MTSKGLFQPKAFYDSMYVLPGIRKYLFFHIEGKSGKRKAPQKGGVCFCCYRGHEL